MSGHTPGPWRVGNVDSEYPPYVQRGGEGGFTVNGLTRERERADALLIAAAPEMLQTLRYCHEWLQGSEPHRARAVGEVITKATQP